MRRGRTGAGVGKTREDTADLPPASRRFTVFLDRDGVFNRHLALGVRWTRDFEWLPGVQEAFARLNRPDVQTVLVTNQPWVGLGMATPRMIRAVNAHLKEGLERAGGRLDRIEEAFAPSWLPHRRLKPRPGMLEDAADALAKAGSPVAKSRAAMVGDKVKDAQAAAAFGVPCILVATTSTAAELEAKARALGVPFAAIVPDLPTAVELLLSWVGP